MFALVFKSETHGKLVLIHQKPEWRNITDSSKNTNLSNYSLFIGIVEKNKKKKEKKKQMTEKRKKYTIIYYAYIIISSFSPWCA